MFSISVKTVHLRLQRRLHDNPTHAWRKRARREYAFRARTSESSRSIETYFLSPSLTTRSCRRALRTVVEDRPSVAAVWILPLLSEDFPSHAAISRVRICGVCVWNRRWNSFVPVQLVHLVVVYLPFVELSFSVFGTNYKKRCTFHMWNVKLHERMCVLCA